VAERRAPHGKTSAPTSGPKRRRALLTLLFFLVISATAVAVIWGTLERLDYPPRLAGPYIERRSLGHNPLIESIGATTRTLFMKADRGQHGPHSGYPGWSGANTVIKTFARESPATREVLVGSSQELTRAIATAKPGDAITIAPGTYRIRGPNSIPVVRPGRPDAAISVRATALGLVTLEFEVVEGFHVQAPYWIFENLTIIGVCKSDSACEHAFHVVGAGAHFVARNNRIMDFNAHFKVNGADGRFPDHGRIEWNSLTNGRVRSTGNPVTPIDLVGANDWSITDNLIADFIKGKGDKTSYGVFAKGAGERTRIERNVVLCELRLSEHAGRRIGMSFGGGGTAPRSCRDGRCTVEQADGVMTSNLIAYCSDQGIYLNKAATSSLTHNTLIDTGGINVRFPESTADVRGNLVDGVIVARDGGLLRAEDNIVTANAWLYLGRHPVRHLMVNWALLDLAWQTEPPRRSHTSGTDRDLCGSLRSSTPAYGAFENFLHCTDRQAPSPAATRLR
jgi:hypothetical protein